MTVKEHWFIDDWLIDRLSDRFLFVGWGWVVPWFLGWQDGNKLLRKLIH